jgi:hypothetical protein
VEFAYNTTKTQNLTSASQKSANNIDLTSFFYTVLHSPNLLISASLVI